MHVTGAREDEYWKPGAVRIAMAGVKNEEWRFVLFAFQIYLQNRTCDDER
jgi:hypothetical protein